MKRASPLLAWLMVASSPAMADVATPSLASTQAISVALLTQGTTECSIDSPWIDDALRSLVDGPGFPEVAPNSNNAVSSQFLVIVTAIPQPKTPGFNPAARDRATSCRVSGRALLLHSDYVPNQPESDIVVEPEESGTLLWRAQATTGEDLSPSGVNVHAERIIRDLVERFSADWRQSQGR